MTRAKIAPGNPNARPWLNAMARILGILILLGIVGYGLWPYYSLFRLNTALEAPDSAALAPLIDMPKVRAHYKARVGDRVSGLVPQGTSDADQMLGWIADNLKQLGDAALDQAITLDWVHGTLVTAVRRANGPEQGSLFAAVDFAFFESWNRFVIRIGKLGQNPTFVVLQLEDGAWRITDLTG